MQLENFQRRGTPFWGWSINPRGNAMERVAVSARIRNTTVYVLCYVAYATMLC